MLAETRLLQPRFQTPEDFLVRHGLAGFDLLQPDLNLLEQMQPLDRIFDRGVIWKS